MGLGPGADARLSSRSSACCCRSSLGAVSLRVGGIAFAMVTLAFAEAGSTLVEKNPRSWTGGGGGRRRRASTSCPSWMVGVFNTKYLYWIALGYLIAVVRRS